MFHKSTVWSQCADLMRVSMSDQLNRDTGLLLIKEKQERKVSWVQWNTNGFNNDLIKYLLKDLAEVKVHISWRSSRGSD